MRQSFKIVPELRDGKLYLHISTDEADDVIGPMDDLSGVQSYTAILESATVLPPGAQPPSKRLRKRAALTEKRVAEEIGGRTQKNSGALPWAKGDVRKKGEHRLEVKTCTLKGYRVSRSNLDKIRGECATGEKPGFIVEFINRLTHKLEDRWILIPFEDWREAHVD